MAWRGYASGDEAPRPMTDDQFVEWCNKPGNDLGITVNLLSRWEEEGYLRPASKRKGVKLYHRDAQVHVIRKIIELQEHGFDEGFMLDILPRFDEWHLLITPVYETWMEHQRRVPLAGGPGDKRYYWDYLDTCFRETAREMRDARDDVAKRRIRGVRELKPDHFEEGHLLISRLIDETDKRMPELEKYRWGLSAELRTWLVIEKTVFTRCPKGHIIHLDRGAVEHLEKRKDESQIEWWHIWVRCTHSRVDTHCTERFDIADRPWRPLRWVEGRKQVCLMCGQAFDLAKKQHRVMRRCTKCQRKKEGAKRKLDHPWEVPWHSLCNVLVTWLL